MFPICLDMNSKKIFNFSLILSLKMSQKYLSTSLLLCIILLSVATKAQDVEPRRWTNIPLGVKAATIGYGYTFGEVLFDPLLEVEEATVHAHTFIGSYVQPFKIGKKFARLDVLVPFSTARWEGLLRGSPASVERTGLADPRIRLSYHILGPPPLSPKELQEYLMAHPVNTTVGVSLGINVPVGQYDEDKLINLGLNQFAFRPQIGVAHNWGLWTVELDASVFVYTKNNSFFNDGTRRQDPLYAAQAHLIKRFKKGLWTSISTSYGQGGTSRVNRLSKDDERANWLNAASFGLNVSRTQSAKITYLYSKTLKDIGSNAHSIILAYSLFFQ